MLAQIPTIPKLVPVFDFSKPYRYRGAHGGRGSGKCLGRGTMLLRADASLVAVEDVRNGDYLLGPDGTPRTVRGVVRGVGPLYRVTQKTGMSFVCNDAHILVLERSKHAAQDYGEISAAGNRQRPNGRYPGYCREAGYSLITASEYAEKPERFKSQHFGFRRAIVGRHKELPVDPYLLGIWLGDGSSKAPEVTSVDCEIVKYLASECEANGWTLNTTHSLGKAPRYYIGSKFQRSGSFCQQLRAAGVFENKHIPEAYFGASVEQRLALLAGLVDTDGHVAGGSIEISQSREHMIDGIIRLAWGLGFKASKATKIVRCNGRDCPSFRSQIGGGIDRLPLLIERKRERAQAVTKNKDWRRTRVDVEPIGVGEYFGFELDGDHLFMLADGTVTHNTRGFALAAALRAFQLSVSGVSGVVLCGREFMNSLEDSSMAEVKAAIESLPWLRAQYDIGEKYIRTANRRVEFVFAGLRHNLDSLKSKSRILIAWIDEAESVSEMAWTKLIPTVREEGSEIWVTWNPEQSGSATDKRFLKEPPSNSAIVQLNYTDNPFFPSTLEQERADDRRRMDDDTYRWVWQGAYRVGGGVVFRQVRTRATAVPQDAPVTDELGEHQYVIGVDWGQEKDFSVFSVIDATLQEQVYLDRSNQVDYPMQMGRLTALYERFKPELIVAEQNSIGRPIIQMLVQQNVQVRPFVTTNASKANAVDALALAFELGTLRILPESYAREGVQLGKIQIDELQAFEATKLPGGLTRYAARTDGHDDAVIALMIAWLGARRLAG